MIVVKKLINWWKRRSLVVQAAVISVVFAVMVHILFLWESSPWWLTADWESGDILVYAGTISLGVIALWQNQKVHDEVKKDKKRDLAMQYAPLFEFGESACLFRIIDKNTDLTVKKIASKVEGSINEGKHMFIIELGERKSLYEIGLHEIDLRIKIKNVGSSAAIISKSNIIVADCNSFEESLLKPRPYVPINLKNHLPINESGLILWSIDFQKSPINQDIIGKLQFQNHFGSNYTQKIIVKITNRLFNEIILTIDPQPTITLTDFD